MKHIKLYEDFINEKIENTGNTGGQSYDMQQVMKSLLTKLGGDWEMKSSDTSRVNARGERISAFPTDSKSKIKSIYVEDLEIMRRSGGNTVENKIEVEFTSKKPLIITLEYIDAYAPASVRDASDSKSSVLHSEMIKANGGKSTGAFLAHHIPTIIKYIK
jgi:hypothetical protein